MFWFHALRKAPLLRSWNRRKTCDNIRSMENKTYVLTLLGKRTPHKVEAVSVTKEQGRLIFKNAKGEESGNFDVTEVKGYHVEPLVSRAAR